MSAMSDVFLCGCDCVENVNRSECHTQCVNVQPYTRRYTYRCIITNDWDSEEKCVIETYNKRGARECDFDRLNNDFGWKHLPCSFLNENTVYMILIAFCMNFFTYFIRAVSSVFTSLSPTSRIKKFVFHFTAVCSKWTRTARSWWLNLHTGMPYENYLLDSPVFFRGF